VACTVGVLGAIVIGIPCVYSEYCIEHCRISVKILTLCLSINVSIVRRNRRCIAFE
jgi:hypothetical protein